MTIVGTTVAVGSEGVPVNAGDSGFIDPTQSTRGKLGWCDAGGIILETFFLSNPKSVATYQAKKQEVIDAIVEVLLDADWRY